MVLVGPEGGYAMDFRPIVAPSIRELFIQQVVRTTTMRWMQES